MKVLTRFAPALVAVLAALWLLGKLALPRDDGPFDVQAFAQLPVVYQGRVKPYDTLARNSLIIISDRQTWRDAEGRRRPAVEWLLDVMSGSPRARGHAVFRIHNLQLLTQLGLERRRGYRYAFDEFEDRLAEAERQAMRASRLDRAEMEVYDIQLLEFWQRVTLFGILSDVHVMSEIGDDPRTFVGEAGRRLNRLTSLSLPHAIPAGSGDQAEWMPMLQAIVDDGAGGDLHPAVRPLAGIFRAWGRDDPAAFNDSVAAFRAAIDASASADEAALGFEALFNHFAPFYHCAVLYVFAILLSCFAWLGWTETLRRSAFVLLATTFVVHTVAIGARVYISGYPPITNLYGTAVFIGWGCVLLGLILEWVYRIDVGNLLSAIVGFLTLVIAHFLAGDGDTLEMMQAVLDTKFWLATHVIIINFGYSATFLAGGLATLFILRGVLTRGLDGETEKVFGRMIYGVLCFALLLSFVGTVLGGLWADDSWGRFWGWDPKENGAMMIVLWNALIVHARWGGMVKTRGLAVLSVFGSIITAWSWFGVNQLGVGLHSYGFTDSVTFWLLVFVGSQLGIMAMGLLPRGVWRSGPRSEFPMTTAQSAAGGEPSQPDSEAPDAGA